MQQFKDKVVLITGGTSGIGLATAKEFAKQGAKVVISGRDKDKGTIVEQELVADSLNINFIQSDSGESESAKKLIESVVSLHGRLDIAFNNAGAGGDVTPMHLQTEDSWDNVMNVNLKGVWLSMKYQLKQFLKQIENGESEHNFNIINMSSLWGVGASDFGVSPYVASKHGVIGLTEAAALEYGKNNIRVNAVCPAWVHTSGNDAVLSNKDFRNHIEAHHPIQRLGKDTEIASAVLWLASKGAGFVTGHSMLLDGGISARR